MPSIGDIGTLTVTSLLFKGSAASNYCKSVGVHKSLWLRTHSLSG